MQARMLVGIALMLSVWVGGCGGGGHKSTGPTTSTTVPNTAVAPGYNLSVYTAAPASNLHPDSIIQVGTSLFIGYQMTGDVKDGSNPALTNQVVQYDLTAAVPTLGKTFTVPGHVDGLMAKSSTEIWAMANEDGNPELTVINLTTGGQTTYHPTVNPPAHGGGFDDMVMINNVVYVTASNPTVAGVAPTVVSLTLNPNGVTFDVAPVLAGNAQFLDITPSVGGSPNPTFLQMITFALTDPDSEAVDPSGNLVVDSQADGRLAIINNVGTATQAASILTLTLFNDKDGPVTPVDDTRFVPAAAGPTGQLFMLFTDASNTTYKLQTSFVAGTAYSCGQGQVMMLDIKTGHLTPVAVSIGNAAALADPHGMVFVTL
jgi:hypothetical protein